MRDVSGQPWGVIGAGSSGLAAARLLLAWGARVTIVDDAPAKREVAASALAGAADVCPATEAKVDCVAGWVVSPGVPPAHPLVAAALARQRVWSDLDLWQARRRVCTVAVTGTNGKSTVTRLVAAMAAKGGRTVLAGGNLGTPVADLLARPADLAVLEVSSFQLFYSRTFVPEIAVLTNFAPDHLDWHPTLEHYRASKERMFARLAEEGIAVLPDVEDGGIRIPPAARVFRFGSDAACDARITGEALELNVLRTHARLAFPKAFDPEHQRRNLAAAALVGALLGGTPEALRAAASSYRHLPHRFVEVANVAGVRYVDDSKATNLHALIAAVRSVGTPVRLLVGGKRKNLDWAAALPHIADQIVGAYAFGECGADVAAAWRPTLPVEVDNHLAAALARASADARAGETVLLAPGTSSFDQYESYAERGQHFCELVGSLTGGTS